MILYNSLSQKFEQFKPNAAGEVSIYVCGITPYDTTHLGHAFTYISFDALIRYLKFKGFKVNYTQNVTDINDRDKDILQKAKEQNVPWHKLSQIWTKRFLKDMKTLNWIMPQNYLKASEQIPSMIDLIQKLLENGLAYEVSGNVYLDISKKEDFGKLSKFSKTQMLKLAEEFEEDLSNKDKSHPLDITLWKAKLANQPSHIPFFNSPFGLGRPGWHIECSAMSISTLGEQIDIHGGGIDLIFPHHEAEIAQSEEATGKIPFVKYWIHTAPLFYKGEKMSKSKGNLIMVSTLLKKYSPNAIRWLLLSHHWINKWEYNEQDLIKAQHCVQTAESNLKDGDLKEFTKIMDDNLNTPAALELLLKSHNKKIYQILGFK